MYQGRDSYGQQIHAVRSGQWGDLVARGTAELIDFSRRVGLDDLLFVTLDTLRYDVAVELAAAGRTPNLVRALPAGRWERRHTPGSFTYAAHHAFFAGFLPTPAEPAEPGDPAGTE